VFYQVQPPMFSGNNLQEAEYLLYALDGEAELS